METTEFRSKTEKIVERLRGEVASLRTARATPALVENLEVDCYGTPTLLKALAAISNPAPRELLIQPWDKNVLPQIERAIQTSPLGLSPIADQGVIRLSIPPLTEERRKELLRVLGKRLEESRIQVRRERDEALKELERRYKAKEISEDERFRRKSETQKIVDEVNKKIEDLGSAKEREILAV